MNRQRRYILSIAAAAWAGLVHAKGCVFDNAGASLTREGVVLTRFASGVSGNALVANTGFASSDAATIASNIKALGDQLDVNRNGRFDATDATIIARKIAGYSDAASTAGIPPADLGPSGVTGVQSFLLSGCGSALTWNQGGNAFGTPGVIGTTDAQSLTITAGGPTLELVAKQGTTFRLMQRDDGAAVAPFSSANIVGGSSANMIADSALGPTIGATVSGGGAARTLPDGSIQSLPNAAHSSFGTVAGGASNVADGYGGVVSGGLNNTAGAYGTVPGGYGNSAATGSFAAGTAASATHANAFVWNGGADAFASAGDRSFNINAPGSVQLSPQTSMRFGSAARQMLNLFGDGYGIGVQQRTMYFRNDGIDGGGFAWFAGGSHADGLADPGPGGTLLMQLKKSSGSIGLDVLGNFSAAGVVVANGANFNGAVSTTFLNMPSNATINTGFIRAFQGIVSSGVVRAAGFETVSDRRLKQDIVPVSTTSVLDRVMRLPVSTWRFTGTSTTRIGPMAQDFHALFGLGDGDTSISLADSSGVALAAIQGLNAIVQAKERRLKALEARILALESMLQAQAPSGVRRRPSR